MIRPIIGITGPKRHGKDTCARYFRAEYGYRHTAFADPLKRACAEAFGINLSNFTDDELKDGPCPAYPQFTNRYILQHVGTELFRNFIDTIWVDTTMRKAAGTATVISDVRFQNEAEAIRAHGGFIIRVYDPRKPHVDMHASERDIMNLDVDYDVTNAGTLAELYNALDRIATQESL